MNYERDNKIWRVLGPLFAFLGIRFLVETIFYVVLWHIKFKEINVSAAFNGILYMEEYGEYVTSFTLFMSMVSLLISIPIMYLLMKKDYEYPINPRRKEKSFKLKAYLKNIDTKRLNIPIIVGATAAMGVGRFITMLPFDGILGNYKTVQENIGKSSVWMQLLVLGILTPVLEELLFRGVIYKRLKMYYEVTVAAYIAAIIFAIAHFNLIQGIYAFIVGIVLMYVYEKSGNLIAPIVMHGVANIVTVIMGVNPISRFIDSHIVVRILVSVAMIAVFVMAVLKINEKNREEE